MDYLVHINGNDYVAGGTTIASLRSHLLAAVRAGGGFVDLPGPSPAGTAALVTPESAVWIEPAPGQVTADEAGATPDIAFIEVEAPRS